jgi:glucan phosphoethanolaminetransferase (alkaline phosphatase superfamily)
MAEHPGITEPEPRGTTAGWIIAFLLFPYGPFIYLAKLKVITKGFACFAVLASAVVHSMVSVLVKTNGSPWQHWLVLLMGVAFYLLGALQFMAGERKNIWSDKARKDWRLAGWFCGCVLIVSLLVQILVFHMSSTMGKPTP